MSSSRVKVSARAEFLLTTDQLAEAFCQLDAEGQAQFFCLAGEIAARTFDGPPSTQWAFVGAHLGDWTLPSTDLGRAVVREIAEAMAGERTA